MIRIGDIFTQTAAFVAGISGVTSASGVAVLVNSSGQLGTTTSSRRFKDEIADMGRESDVLMKLRPVTFYYKPGTTTRGPGRTASWPRRSHRWHRSSSSRTRTERPRPCAITS